MSNESGQLYVVATPIGNLADLTERARTTLAAVAVIAAEDTRHSAGLLNHLGIRVPLISLHEHNEQDRVSVLVARLQAGEDVALISDAGTPLISDPGYRLVRAAQQAGIAVLAVPGASSVMAALSVAGLPTDRFLFEGFLPARSSARQQRLQALAGVAHTLVLFEAGRRLQATLTDLVRAMGGEREAAICRELTKRFETTRSDSLEGLCEWVANEPDQTRGEIVLLVGPATQSDAKPTPALPSVVELLALLRGEGLGAKSAARIAARLTGESVNALYAQAIKAPSSDPS